MRRISHVAGVVIVGAVLAGAAMAATSGTSLTLVAYSTPKAAYSQLIPAFQNTAAGKDVTFSQSYGPSGTQSQLVLRGLKADVVMFSLYPDMERLVGPGIVAANWNADAYHGMVTDSVVVLSVRPGNPKHIKGWDDLIKQGVDVITPNPFIAGGKGDVLIGYENEAIFAKKNNVPLQYIVPSSTILIENPIAATKSAPPQAKAFVQWLRTPAAQKIWADNGYRPVVKSVLQQFHFAKPAKLFKITSLGGWNQVQKKFFDRQSGLMLKVEQAAQGG